MPYASGAYHNLAVVGEAPSRTISPSGLVWAEAVNQAIYSIISYSEDDDTYMVRFFTEIHGSPEHWIWADWIQELSDLELMRRVWRTETMSEASRQLKYADAFNRLLWREMRGAAKRVKVGDKVTIKSGASRIETAFPSTWDSDYYGSCMGHSGTVTRETREMGADGELYRGYLISIPGRRGNGSLFPELWWLGDDLK